MDTVHLKSVLRYFLTPFITNRRYEINEKRNLKTKNSKKVKMINSHIRVINSDVGFLDETKLDTIAVSCIISNEQY
jgi:hypothetical protein